MEMHVGTQRKTLNYGPDGTVLKGNSRLTTPKKYVMMVKPKQ